MTGLEGVLNWRYLRSTHAPAFRCFHPTGGVRVPKVDPIINRSEGSQSRALWIPALTAWGGGGGGEGANYRDVASDGSQTSLCFKKGKNCVEY